MGVSTLYNISVHTILVLVFLCYLFFETASYDFCLLINLIIVKNVYAKLVGCFETQNAQKRCFSLLELDFEIFELSSNESNALARYLS